MNVTLHNPKTGFFGRTYKGKALKLKFNAEANELVSDDQDWVLFYTSTEAVETKAVVEAILVEEDSNKKRKLHGLGYSIVPLFHEDLPL